MKNTYREARESLFTEREKLVREVKGKSREDVS